MTKTVMDIFPSGLYAEHDILTPEENEILIQKIHSMREEYGVGNTNDWYSGVYSPDNCFKLLCLTQVSEFKTLIDKVKTCVEDYARYYGSMSKYECVNGWYNIYTSGKYQEFHIHPDMIFSAVYFLRVPDGANGITFKRPMHSMLPPKNIQVETPWNQEVITAPPKEGTVVIFRSDLYHSVLPSNFKSERITVALNYK